MQSVAEILSSISYFLMNLRILKTIIRKPIVVSKIDGDHHPRSTTKSILTVPLIPNQELERGALL
jgi:hypothetical protein